MEIKFYTIQDWRKTHKNDLNKPIMIKNHDLKCDAEYFDKVASGDKNFELRFNDRDFQVDETITLHRFIKDSFTGSSLKKRITYVLKDAERFGLKDGYVILSIENI